MMLLAVAGMNAQTWTAPEAPASPFENVDYEADGATAYFLYNVGTGRFLSAGNSWATQISLGSGFEPYMEIVVEPMTGDDAETYPDAVKLKLNGAFYFSGGNGRTNYKVENTYLFRDSETSGFIDHNNQATWYWNFTKAENGHYYWHSAFGMNYADAENQYAQGTGDGAPVVFDATEADDNIEWQFVPVVGTDKAAVAAQVEAVFAVYDAKKALYDLTVKIEEEGLDVDYSSYAAVYAGSDIEALKKAYEELFREYMAARVALVFEGASADNPVDGTSLLVNPAFDAGNISGWVCTFVSGQNATNVGYQANSTYTNGDVELNQFIEAWANSAFNKNVTYRSVGDGELSQTVRYLPAGKYSFTCDAISNQQDGQSDPATGVQLFATGGDIDKYTSIATGNGAPEHFELVFASTGGDLTVGLRTRNATANWIAADNFTLWYYGPADPWQTALEDALNDFDEQYGDVDEIHAQASLKEAATVALEAARAELAKADGNYEEAYNNLVAALEALNASASDYARLRSYIDTWMDKLMNLEGKWAEVSDGELGDKIQELEDAYEAGSYSSEDIEKVISEDVLGKGYAEGIGELVEAGDDLTFLLNNPGFENDFSGWTINKGSIQFGGRPITLDDGTEITSGVAEVWKGAFDFSQTIYNMPEGLYTLSVKAFERNEDDQSIRTTSSELYAIVAGETQTVKTKNINADATEEELFRTDMAGANAVGTENDKQNADGLWIPNGRCGANAHFYYGGYENKFNILVNSVSDIVVGMRDEATNNWVLFDDFRIVYQGSGANAYTQAILDLIAEAEKLQNSDNPETGRVLTEEAYDGLTAACDKGHEVVENPNATKDECVAVMTLIQDAMTFANESMDLTAKLFNQLVIYRDYRQAVVASSDEDFTALLAEIESRYYGDATFKTNADVQNYMDVKLPTAYTKYVQYDFLATASEEEPADITAVIYNPDGNGYAAEAAVGAEGWTISKGTIGYGNGNKEVCEFYETDFDINQTILGLAPGYYVLGVQGFYRDGNSARIDSCLNKVEGFEEHKYAHLYADEVDTYMLPVSTELSEFVEWGLEGTAKITVDGTELYVPNTAACADAILNSPDVDQPLYQNLLLFQVKEGQESVVIGLRKTHNANVAADEEAGIEKFEYYDWTIFDNWTLKYLGTKAPTTDPTTDIQGVEAEAPVAVAIYNLAGQRVQKAVKGLYIINGKKVLVK